MPLSTTDSDWSTVTASSQKMAAMATGHQYILRADIALWYKVGPNASVSVSAAADGAHYLAAGATALVAKQGTNDTVAVIRAGSSDGNATLSLLQGVI